MKKTLIAIAAIAAMGAASAEVTLYGKVDMGVSNTSANGTSVGISGWETSRFGVKASEAVAGLTLSANLEGKIQDDVGKFAGFDRVATVGVAGAFGAVTVGTQWTPFDNAVWTTDSLEYNGFTPLKGLKAAWNYDVGNTTNGYGNAKGSIQYATPDMNGFQAIVLIAPNVKDAYADSANYSGVGLNYTKGPLVINFATQSQSGNMVKDASDNYSNVSTATVTSNVVAVNYNIGAANLYGGMVNSDNGAGTTDKGYIMGVKVPMGADSVSLGYASNKNAVAGAEKTIGAWGAQYIKSLSKAAVAYVGVQSVDTVNKTGAGVRYAF